jgi:hypothetical protein
MSDNWRDDTDEIDFIASDERAPVTLDMFDVKLAGNFCGMLAMCAGDSNDARAFAVLETGDLRRAREAGSDDTYSDCLCDYSTSVVSVFCFPAPCRLPTAF